MKDVEISMEIVLKTPRAPTFHAKTPKLQHVALQPPIISTKTDDEELEDVTKCFGCWEPIANYAYFSPDCGFNLHKKCAELPLTLDHKCHRKHPLLLQFNSDRLSCKICQHTWDEGFVYGCLTCKFVVHIECFSSHLVPVIKDERHEHPFSLFPRRTPFICDACGTEGTYSAYMCCECNILVHKKCTSLPSIIKSRWHDHAIFHNYFLPDDFGSSNCIICHDAVNPEHGSYCCSYCNDTFHVRCVTKEASSYSIVSREDANKISYESSITCVLERNDAGEATEIQHFKHTHNLQLSSFVGGCENSCDGCMLPISDPFYSCSQCEFFLHKTCVELPKKKHVWHHKCRQLSFSFQFIINVMNIFLNSLIMTIIVIQKVIIVIFVKKVEIHIVGFIIVQYPFIKLGSIYEEYDHPHPLTFVKKSYYYPDCDECHEPCEDLALQCTKSGCNYIVHWNCVAPDDLQRWDLYGM
ncbi:uncharacterized protein LOC120128342 [Hibiscus syriacus]|uniref:uncharacterized protein LOC120128342 n=1 Tax=Hibiscus syriacus TaxID=106335 RepID=UPI0019249372|nr:uncharacterized protein LOC120128342 [Hibiscus syriacus]